MDRFLTVEDLSGMFGVHEETVRRHIRKGKYPGVFLHEGQYFIQESDLNRIIEYKTDPKMFLIKAVIELRNSEIYKQATLPEKCEIMRDLCKKWNAKVADYRKPSRIGE